MSCEPRSTHVDSDNSTERRAFSFDHWLVARFCRPISHSRGAPCSQRS
jgi:hypothetical protein